MRIRNEKGSLTTEFVIGFVLTFIGFLILVEFVFLAIGSELMSYGSYMGARSLKSNPLADVERVVHQAVPWVPADQIFRGEIDGRRWVVLSAVPAPILNSGAPLSILTDELRLNVAVSMIAEPTERKPCEDNPLWDIPGGEPCGS